MVLISSAVFPSHAIPIHLITRAAVRLYLAKLAEHGLLAFHISNPALRLESVLGALTQDASLVGLVQTDRADEKVGKAASIWLILAQRQVGLQILARDARWKKLSGGAHVAVWTDDFSNPLAVLKPWEYARY